MPAGTVFHEQVTVLRYCRSYVLTEEGHDAMLVNPPASWNDFGSAWDVLVESYCYCEPNTQDFSIPKVKSE